MRSGFIVICLLCVCQSKNITLRFLGFSFEKFPDITSLGLRQPFNLGVNGDYYFSSVYQGLKSPSNGNITQIKFFAMNSSTVDFQIWQLSTTKALVMKKRISVSVPQSKYFGIYTAELPEVEEIEEGDMIGLWFSKYFAVGFVDGSFLKEANKGAYTAYADDYKSEKPSSNSTYTLDGGRKYEASHAYHFPALEILVQMPPESLNETSTPPQVMTESTVDAGETRSQNLSQPSAESTTVTNVTSTGTTNSEDTTTATERITHVDSATTQLRQNVTNEVESTYTMTTVSNGQSPHMPLVAGLDRDIFIIVIVVPISVALIIIVIIVAVCITRKNQTKEKKAEELRRTYEPAGSSNQAVSDADSDEYHYPNPQIHLMQTLDRNTYAKIRKSSKPFSNHEPTYESMEGDETNRKPVILQENELYEPTRPPLPPRYHYDNPELFENELYTPC